MSNIVKYQLKTLQKKMTSLNASAAPIVDDEEMLRPSYQAVNTTDTERVHTEKKSFIDEFNYSSLSWSDANRKPSLYMVVGIAVFIFIVLILTLASSNNQKKPAPCPEPIMREASTSMLKTNALINLDALKCKSQCTNACASQKTEVGSFCCEWSTSKDMKSCGMTFTNDGACYCVGEAIDFSVLLQSLASHSSAETAIPEAK